MVESRFGDTPDIQALESILHNRAIKVRGKIETFNNEVDEALEPVRTGALRLLSDTINTGLTVDSIIVSGGFALSSYQVISKEYPQSVKSDNPLYDTAQGYFNYSMFKEW